MLIKLYIPYPYSTRVSTKITISDTLILSFYSIEQIPLGGGARASGSSIAMGLGIDYSVYIVYRLREEMLAHGQNRHEALRTTLSSTGAAIIISVVVLLGSFIPLLNTELANLWSVSLYISGALILDVATALMLLPLLVYWLKPKYIFGKESGEAN